MVVQGVFVLPVACRMLLFGLSLFLAGDGDQLCKQHVAGPAARLCPELPPPPPPRRWEVGGIEEGGSNFPTLPLAHPRRGLAFVTGWGSPSVPWLPVPPGGMSERDGCW